MVRVRELEIFLHILLDILVSLTPLHLNNNNNNNKKATETE